jgi:hypothetical protein
VEVSVLHGLKQGNEVLKEIHKEMNIEAVEKLLEETNEAQEYQRVCTILWRRTHTQSGASQEMGEMLSNNLTNDEKDSVQDELRQLQADIVSPAGFHKCVDTDLGLSFGRLNHQRLSIYPQFLRRIPPRTQMSNRPTRRSGRRSRSQRDVPSLGFGTFLGTIYVI